jgi:hypothetical protein
MSHHSLQRLLEFGIEGEALEVIAIEVIVDI